jgi:hypothetical protein
MWVRFEPAGCGLLGGDPAFPFGLGELQCLRDGSELVQSGLQVLHDLLGDDLGRL